MRVGLVGQKDNARAGAIVGDICAELASMGVDLAVDEVTAAALGDTDDATDAGPARGVPVAAMADCDLVVSIGGDGTFLFTARGAGSTPIMGVNLGEVGFLNAVPPEEAEAAVRSEVERFQRGDPLRTREMPRLTATAEGVSLRPALNEIVVQGPQRGHGRGAAIEVRVDGSLYTSGRADGVLVATPTGSTAYNLSEGGPLVHPGIEGFVVTDMCGHEPMPPLVVDTDSEFTVTVRDAETAYVVADGRNTETLSPPATVTLRAAAEPVAIAGPPLDFFAALGKLE
jgi:NAD+ kinase